MSRCVIWTLVAALMWAATGCAPDAPSAADNPEPEPAASLVRIGSQSLDSVDLRTRELQETRRIIDGAPQRNDRARAVGLYLRPDTADGRTGQFLVVNGNADVGEWRASCISDLAQTVPCHPGAGDTLRVVVQPGEVSVIPYEVNAATAISLLLEYDTATDHTLEGSTGVTIPLPDGVGLADEHVWPAEPTAGPGNCAPPLLEGSPDEQGTYPLGNHAVVIVAACQRASPGHSRLVAFVEREIASLPHTRETIPWTEPHRVPLETSVVPLAEEWLDRPLTRVHVAQLYLPAGATEPQDVVWSFINSTGS